MVLFSLLLLLWSVPLPGVTDPGPGAAPAGASPIEAGAARIATYDAAQRAVDNWREEAVRALDPKPLSLAAVMLQVDRPIISRCVKLNNYWCIKRARWTGEIGGDEENHTGFASASAGADAAVALLRRYYVGYGRRSALDIVRRWAPAACRIGGGGFSGFSAVLAVRGLANTLRARFLAARRGAPSGPRVGRAAAPRRAAVSRVPLAPMPSFRVPDIAAGMGERKPPARAATAPRPGRPRAALVQAGRPRAVPKAVRTAQAAATSGGGCGDELRIQNYAARIAAAAETSAGDDLKLFDSEGRPLPSLTRVLLAMSSVELGLLHATSRLVDEAVARLAPVPAAATPPEAPVAQ